MTRTGWILLAALGMLVLLSDLMIWRMLATSPRTSVVTPPTASVLLAPRTHTTGCALEGPLPDPDCTPGAIFAGVTAAQICRPGYATSVRNVPDSLKRQTYSAYLVPSRRPGQYEVDHLVSLQLGGSNDAGNLFPQIEDRRAAQGLGYQTKNAVESAAHAAVCRGEIALEDVQRGIAQDWVALCRRLNVTPACSRE